MDHIIRSQPRNHLNEGAMDHNSETLSLVRQAGVGNKECMEKLLELTRPRLFAYLMRLTMDYHLAEDLLQDVQTQILTSLWRLNKTNAFWPWIYKYAWGKAQHHYRDTRKHETIFLSDVEKDFIDDQFNTLQLPEESVCDDTYTEELLESIYGAMKRISLKQRNVLTMRCYEDMSFYEISEFLDCSETNARVLFYRAKRKLKKQLRRKGYRANKTLLPAIGLFGIITSKGFSATTTTATISSSSVEVGFGASFIGFITTKTGLFLSGVFSTIVAWFTLTHLFIIAAITVLLIPVILIFFVSFAFKN